MKESRCHSTKMAAYYQEVRQLEDKFHGLELNHITRWLNEAADALAKVASSQEPIPTGIFASDQHKPSIHYEKLGQTSNEPPALGSGADQPSAPFDPKVMELDEELVAEPNPPTDWRTPYLDCLIRKVLPADKMEARWLAHRAKSFTIIEAKLYKQSHTKILQRCIPIKQGKRLLEDIHSGVCGHQATPRTLVGNTFRQGFC
jgi:hypothetical protein